MKLNSFKATRVAARCLALGWLALQLTETSGLAQVVGAGGIAREFTLTNRKTGAAIQLSDFAGQVVFLDFFAYW